MCATPRVRPRTALVLAAGAMGVQTRAFALVGVRRGCRATASPAHSPDCSPISSSTVGSTGRPRWGCCRCWPAPLRRVRWCRDAAVAAPLLPPVLVAAVLFLTLRRPGR